MEQRCIESCELESDLRRNTLFEEPNLVSGSIDGVRG